MEYGHVRNPDTDQIEVVAIGARPNVLAGRRAQPVWINSDTGRRPTESEMRETLAS
jgi:hypothetical protein